MQSSAEKSAAQQLSAAGIQLQAGKSGKIRAVTVPDTLDTTQLPWDQFELLIHLAKFDAVGALINDEQLAIIARLPRLAQLDLTNATGITDASREPLQQMAKLQMLKLTGTSITPETVQAMRKQMIQTRIVYL